MGEEGKGERELEERRKAGAEGAEAERTKAFLYTSRDLKLQTGA